METEKRSDRPADQKKPDGNLLQAVTIKVVRLKRNLLLIGAGIIAGVLAASFNAALAPKKRVSAQEIPGKTAETTPSDAKASLPDQVTLAPNGHGDLHRPGAQGTAHPGGVSQGRDSLEGDHAAGNPGGTAGDRGENLTPGERATGARDQARKDSANATRAPLTFGGVGAGGSDPAPLRDAGLNLPNPPDANGMNRIIEKLSGAGQGPGEPEDQNQQNEKRGFTREDRKDFPYLKTTLLTPISPYEVKAGSILPGVLITGINSDLPGQIVAQARENVYDTASGRYLLVPQGSRFIGEYDSKISYGQERILVVWTRIIMPNGNSISLENMPGVDLSGYAGATGAVNNHYGKLVAGVVLGSVLGAGAQVAVGGQGAPNVPPSFGQLFVSGAAQNVNQAGQQITQKNLNLQPTIEVAAGQKVNIFVTKDMILKPYAD